jgi:hypothetical protein
MDMATLEYLKDTEQLERIQKRDSEEALGLEGMAAHGFEDAFAWPTASVRDLLLARGGSITRGEYDAFKRGVQEGQAKYWTAKQAR